MDKVFVSGDIVDGGLEKIGDAPKPCLSPQHNPPMHIRLEPGTYKYTCPNCGQVTVFSVPTIY